MIQKNYLLFVILFCCCNSLFSQTISPNNSKKKIHEKIHFYNSVGNSFSAGATKSSGYNTGINIHQVIEYDLYDHLRVGLGIGFDVFNLNNSPKGFVPFYINLHGRPLDKKFSFFYKASFGYARFILLSRQIFFQNQVEFKSGLMAQVGTGISIKRSNSQRVQIGVGYKFQNATRIGTGFTNFEDTIQYRQVCTFVGWSF